MSEKLRPIWIDTCQGVRETAQHCAQAGRFALDTEADSMHSYFHKVCLIQVTASDRHAVIDPLALEPADLEALWTVVGDPSVQVLMHGADYDVRILDRDYGVRIAGLEDTQIMAQLLGEERTGLAALLEKELGVRLDKKFQRADWGRRPLQAELLSYAASDTAYLGRLVDRLRARLEEQGRWSWALEEFQRLEGVRHAAPEPDPAAFERIKGARSLRGADRDRLFTLHGWRDRQARSLDVPPFKVLGNQQLMAMATDPPEDLEGLNGVQGIGPRAVRRWGRELLTHLRRPETAPDRVPTHRPPTLEPAVRKRVKRLRAARDARAADLGLPGGLVCPRGCVDAVAAREPVCHTKNDLAAAGLEGWRLEVLGDVFLAALAGN